LEPHGSACAARHQFGPPSRVEGPQLGDWQAAGHRYFVVREPIQRGDHVGQDLGVKASVDLRLVMMVWQAGERNEWEVAIRQSLEAAASEGLDAFSLADPPAVTGILEAAGFASVSFTDVHESVYYGPDVAAALDWVRGFRCTSDVLGRLDPAAVEHALGRLRELLAGHLSGDGVWFDSRAWIVSARHR
jgi:hypothetical protein